MLQTDRTGTSELEVVDIPTAGEDRFITPSMLYNVLPTLVSNRIPTIPSLRRSLSGKRHTKSHSLTEIPAPETPPPDYTSRAPSGSATPNNTFGETDYEFSDAASERPASSASTVPPPFASYETKTGIKWKYASQGMRPEFTLPKKGRTVLTVTRDESDDPCVSRIEYPYPRDRRDHRKPYPPAIHTQHDVPATGPTQ